MQLWFCSPPPKAEVSHAQPTAVTSVMANAVHSLKVDLVVATELHLKLVVQSYLLSLCLFFFFIYLTVLFCGHGQMKYIF